MTLQEAQVVLGPQEEFNMVTWDELVSLLSYNEDTGVFTWLINTGSKKKGSRAGSTTVEGYCRITIKGTEYRLHRLAWFYIHKEWPPNVIDHINRDRADNRICNLRLATVQQNKYNMGLMSTSTTLMRGVSLYKRTGKYQAKIRIKGVRKHLGYFNTAEEASVVYEKFAKDNFGEFYSPFGSTGGV